MCWKHWSCENEVRSTRNSFGYEVRSKRYHYSWILPLIVFSNSDILVLCRVETHYIHYLPCLPKGGRKHHSAGVFFYQNRKHIIRTWLRIYWDFYMVICLLNKKKKTTKKNFRYITCKSWLLRKRGRRQGREKLTVS